MIEEIVFRREIKVYIYIYISVCEIFGLEKRLEIIKRFVEQ